MNWEIEQLLRGPEVGPLLQQAVRSSGLELQEWSLERVYSRPNAETSARFAVQTEGLNFTLVASTRPLTDAERSALGAVRCTSAAGTLHIWAHPTDPELPGLRIVEDHRQLAARLAQLLGTEVQVEHAQMLVLRPLRRAVYRIVASSDRGFRTVFLKVARPQKMPQLLSRHRACTLVPSTADLGDGILALDQAPGVAMTQLLHMPDSPQICPEGIVSALDSIASEALTLPARRPPADRCASVIDTVVAGGAQRSRLERLVEAIHRQVDLTAGISEPSHGDFHPANLFLTEDGLQPTALIDADTVGPGRRRDDIAMMLAHLLTLPSFDATGYSTAGDTAQALWEATAGDHGEDLGARVAASLLCLAPGARDLQQLTYYLSTAEHLLNSGVIPVTGRVDDTGL